MNPYYRAEELPDSQPFFTESEVNTVPDTDVDNDTEYSQSLISPKIRMRQNRTFGTDAATIDCSTKVLGSNSEQDLTDGQRWPYETRNNIVSDVESEKTRKRKIDYSDHKTKVELDSKKVLNDHEAENYIDSKSEHSENGENKPIVTCNECIFDKEFDKRNYYFGNLLTGELQFLPPCMRSEAYVTILRYVDSLKHKHRNKENN